MIQLLIVASPAWQPAALAHPQLQAVPGLALLLGRLSLHWPAATQSSPAAVLILTSRDYIQHKDADDDCAGASWITQALLLCLGSIQRSLPIISGTFLVVITAWITSVRLLNKQLQVQSPLASLSCRLAAKAQSTSLACRLIWVCCCSRLS